MARIVLVTGGARSGKSTFAESQYLGIKDVVYIATSRIYDKEMEDRIRLHREQRPKEWKTFENNYNLEEAVCGIQNYLLDCITVLTSNIMFDITKDYEKIPFDKQREVEDTVVNEISKLVEAVRNIDGNLVMVTNEVGDSIVPENHVARVYRDIVGRVNQKIASMCDEVYIVACGLPLRLK
ncbi:cobinamide kinase [Fervidicella metallireducens AeB]|uniref:Adenosylcobinamide kinase n=1 Tax=Fervidicella metallireducens AeB TaxID=1403537 RepID=A0A017RX05_9CLOT|nr:bifunctional adenosylcobinamide kinase/adenosylcobinamide-phosphate guanylyltransferase [Fervidicella metallireducens]EYE89217.1 cobinamide kinase [Fervidicella metallireducens AeB]